MRAMSGVLTKFKPVISTTVSFLANVGPKGGSIATT